MTRNRFNITRSTPVSIRLVNRFADVIIAEIGVTAREGVLIDVEVGCWHDLHGHVDANELVLAAEVPWGTDVDTDADPDGTRWVTAVENRVDELLHEASGTGPCGSMAACNLR